MTDTTTNGTRSSANTILETLKIIVPKRKCIEMRGQNLRGYWWSGFYDCDNLEKMVKDAEAMDLLSKGIYVTLNSTDETLLARRKNRLVTTGIKKGDMTSDEDITNWDKLPIDIDPVRKTGISSTDEELKVAYEKAVEVSTYLETVQFGYPSVFACSGNGWHLLYNIDYPRSETNDTIIKDILERLAERFDTPIKVDDKGDELPDQGIRIGIDTVNNNPSRIFKLYGTMARKGENTKERPHRLSYIKEHRDNLPPVPLEVLKGFITAHPLSDGFKKKSEKKGRKKIKNQRKVTGRHPVFLSIVGKLVNDGSTLDMVQAYMAAYNAGIPEPKPQDVLTKEIADIYDHCTKKADEEKKRREEMGNRDRIYAGHGYTIFKAAEDCINVVKRKNIPERVFTRAYGLVDIVTDAERGIPVIRMINEDALTAIVNPMCEFFYKMKDKSDGLEIEIETRPPTDVVKHILNTQEYWKGIPVLNGITSCPVISMEDGSICQTPGYDKNLKVLYVQGTNSVPLLSVPEKPTLEDVKKSVNALNDIISEFFFVERADKANTIAMFVSSVIRTSMSDVMYPMAVVTKPIQGVGASKITRYCQIIRNGTEPDMIKIPHSEEEVEKKLLAAAKEGSDFIAYDNIDGPLYYGTIASQITRTTYTGRILGKTEKITIPFTPIWIANGINVIASGDMPRRCYFIRIDPQTAKPWLKCDWKHKDLDTYVKGHRADLLTAIFTLVRYWIQAGKPAPVKSMPVIGGFETWCNTIGGILSSTEYADDFLANLIKGYETCDSESDEWVEFLTQWYREWNTEPIKVSAIVQNIENKGKMAYCLPGEIVNAQARGKNVAMVLGIHLKKKMNRIYQIVVMDYSNNEKKYLTKQFRIGQKLNPEDGTKMWCLEELVPILVKKEGSTKAES
jgi:hypothetical protein